MKARVSIIIVIVIALMIILALAVKTKPFEDYPGNHVEELKQIPEVNMFYEKYGNYGVSVFPDGVFSYQIGFQSGISEDQWIMLKVNYRFGFPSNVFVHCTPQGIQSQYTIRDNVLEYLSEENCFKIASESVVGSETEPEPEPEPMPDSESLQRQKQQQAKLDVQKWVLTDTRDRVNQINAIREYRDEFESGYFLEQFIHPIKQNYEKDRLMNFIYGEWGFQPTENTSPKITVYFRSYENYDEIKKINEWQKPKDDASIAIASGSDGFLLMGLHGMPPATGLHEACVVPGEYRVSASNPHDESKVEWGYFTCQRDKFVGEPQPWMGFPE